MRVALLRRTERIGLGFLAVVGVLGLAAWLWDDEAKAPVAADLAIEHKLAIVNAGHELSADDIVVKRFAYLLRVLEIRTRQPKEQIADRIVFTRNYIRERYGRDVTCLAIMEAAAESEGILQETVTLEDFLGAYSILAGR